MEEYTTGALEKLASSLSDDNLHRLQQCCKSEESRRNIDIGESIRMTRLKYRLTQKKLVEKLKEKLPNLDLSHRKFSEIENKPGSANIKDLKDILASLEKIVTETTPELDIKNI